MIFSLSQIQNPTIDLGGLAPALLAAVAVIIVGIINWRTSKAAVREAGATSDANLRRTIEADQQARILERRLTLYGEILTYVAQRRQYRDTLLQQSVIANAENPQQYEPREQFGLEGRAEAIANESVRDSFLSANREDDVVTNLFIVSKLPGMVGEVAISQREKIETARLRANDSDSSLKVAIRAELHPGGGNEKSSG